MIDNIPAMIVFFAEAGGLPDGLTENGFHLMDYLRDHILLGFLAVAILVAVFMTLIWYRISIRKLKGFNKELKECSETIEKQRQQEFELRKELEKKQKELEAALQRAQAAYNEKNAAWETNSGSAFSFHQYALAKYITLLAFRPQQTQVSPMGV